MAAAEAVNGPGYFVCYEFQVAGVIPGYRVQFVVVDVMDLLLGIGAFGAGDVFRLGSLEITFGLRVKPLKPVVELAHFLVHQSLALRPVVPVSKRIFTLHPVSEALDLVER
jgi:hypothetical protein